MELRFKCFYLPLCNSNIKLQYDSSKYNLLYSTESEKIDILSHLLVKSGLKSDTWEKRTADYCMKIAQNWKIAPNMSWLIYQINMCGTKDNSVSQDYFVFFQCVGSLCYYPADKLPLVKQLIIMKSVQCHLI